ncbi:MEDS domain-containing protein [Methanosarcina sp. UBA5]|uniref:MEDS domain-containing protein n=1 Tax=Methanosarcina sp. UBA5 TaxID=1915593 RepID=UPI0025D44FE6|nr:MEDS domain-containing protein [Methanosarcina sp. UBA5]
MKGRIMKEVTRNSGIDAIGNVNWGTHFCQFYNTKQDLVDIIIPYFKAGLENNEFCIWVASNPLEAKKSFKKFVPDPDTYLEKKQIEIIHYDDWYLKRGFFDTQMILNGLVEKLNKALANSYEGLRLFEGIFSLEEEYRDDFAEYEREMNRIMGNNPMLVLCTYSLSKYNVAEIFNIIENHQFALIKREGKWEKIKRSK